MAIGSISNGDSGSSCRDKINQGLSLWDGLIGAIIAYVGSSAPSKWAICNGDVVSRTTYSELFAIVGTTFGIGDGSTTFNLPDLRGRIPVGVNGLTFSSLGTLVGEETHTLTEAELPVVAGHSHGYLSNGAGSYMMDGAGSFDPLQSTLNTDVAGGFGSGNAHNNIQPSLGVNYIIYTGV